MPHQEVSFMESEDKNGEIAIVDERTLQSLCDDSDDAGVDDCVDCD